MLKYSDSNSFINRLSFFIYPFDDRYEDLRKGNWKLNVLRDITAGLIVAMVAIPLAMGFAMASGLQPEQGIVGGAVAGLVGALFGGSKYQVYGPTAAFIPIIASLMGAYNHSFLVLASLLAGVVLMILGLFRLGRVVEFVPQSIVVGFTIGIACVIGFSQIGEALGLPHKLGYNITEQIPKIVLHIEDTNVYALLLAGLTFLLCKYLLKVSLFIPAPLIALGVCYLLANYVWEDKNLVLIREEYGAIPTHFSGLTLPNLPPINGQVIYDLFYYVTAIIFVAGVESLLCSRMADRVANNKGLPFNPNKELWGQGLVNIFTPLLNGFPHTGALARTSVNIRVGAISPLAGIFKFIFKLSLAIYLAQYLEHVPMACIGGILLYVANGMVKTKEIKEILHLKNWFHTFLMIYTAIMVLLVGFMGAVMSAVLIYGICYYFEKFNAKIQLNQP